MTGSLSRHINRLSKILRSNSEEEVKDYKRRFEFAAKFYEKFLKDFIVQGIDVEKVWKLATEFFGGSKVKFAAIDGTEYSRDIADLVLFFGGAYCVLGEVEFKEDSLPLVTYSPNIFESGRGVSACVPIYVNEVSDIDQVTFGEGVEEEEFSISLEDTEVISNAQIAHWIMNFAEYFLAYKMVEDEGVKILLLDRNLSGDQAGFISKTSRRSLWSKLAIHGLEVDGIRINENHLEILRYYLLNWDLDTPSARGDYLKFKIIFLLQRDGELSLEEIDKRLGIEEDERKERVKRALRTWLDREVVLEKNGKYKLSEEYLDFWEKIKKLVVEIGNNIFLGKDYANVMKVKKEGKYYWLTTLDLAFLSLIMLYMLLEECWKKKVLLIGLTKDTSARDFKNHLIPVLQNMGLIKIKITPEDLTSLPNTDRMFLQSISILNYEKIKPPWSSIEYDASFATIVPEEKNFVRGAIKNKISPERIFLKSYIQLTQANRDPKIRSNVLAMNRLVYPDYDFQENKILHLVNKYTERIHEPVDVIVYKSNGMENDLQNLVNAILVSMTDSSILEVFGHNKPLFIADKLAKWHVGLFIKIIQSLELWIRGHPELKDFIFYMSSFRERRREIEELRRGD